MTDPTTLVPGRARRPRGQSSSAGGELGPVAPELLGPVQRAIGAVEQAAGVLAPVPQRDARRARLLLGHGLAEALDELDRLVLSAARHGERELLAAVAGQQIARAQAARPGDGRRLEQDVAGEVAALVVEALEAVDVEHGDAQRRPVAARAAELAPEGLLPGAAVRQAGELVGARRALEAGEDVEALE